MVEPAARIRRYGPSDNKLVRFFVGKSHMESLAVANQWTYVHPLTLAVWVGLSSVFIQLMGWWPREHMGFWGKTKPIPAFAAVAVLLMSIADWMNRPTFEDRAQEVLRRPDILDIEAYYSQSPSSGLWILEYGDTFVGFIAIDASLNAQSDSSVMDIAKTGKKKDAKIEYKKGTSAVANVRHFYVQDAYRVASVQDDLLQFAVKHAFSSSSTVQSITALDPALSPYLGKALRAEGFEVEKVVDKVGLLKWEVRSRVLRREKWESQKQS